MQDIDRSIAELGNEPPLLADNRSGPPDRREVSARWLSGTFLTGATSIVLLGVALFGAMEGRVLVATPPEIADIAKVPGSEKSGEAAKSARLVTMRQIARAKDRRRIAASAVSREGEREVIRAMPLLQINMALAANYKSRRNYPAFDPIAIMADPGANPTANSTQEIVAPKIESEMALNVVDFPIATANFDESTTQSAESVEEVVRTTGMILTDGDVQVAALHYVDPQRFGDSLETETITASYGFKITPENVSYSPRDSDDQEERAFAEDIIPVMAKTTIAAALAGAGYTGPDAKDVTQKLTDILHGQDLKEGQVLRVGLDVRGEAATIVRLSIYDGASAQEPIICLAVNDDRQYVPARELPPSPGLAAAFDDTPPVIARSNLPTVYDGIHRAADSYGLSRASTRMLLRMLASEVDFQSRVNPSDRIEVVFSEPDEDDRPSPDSELLYVSATFGGQTRNLYRFKMQDGSTDYFDRNGRNTKQFLLRNPVPAGRFTSGFGGRRHPVLGYFRMHTGVDWAAPVGTPIIAAGNGVVEKAGWAGGYGRQTMIRHSNGYVSSYNHQSAFAKGVRPGARVRQGQVIGYVGASGMVTGAHLHYELLVNGAKVDPMRIRLPSGKTLTGPDLTAFKRERNRIDEILKENAEPPLKMASTKANGTSR